MKKEKFSFSRINMLIVLALFMGFTACKNKKKAGEISDPNEVKEQIEEEIANYEEEESDDRVAVKEPNSTQKLHNYFGAIAGASSPQAANGSISEALTMFSTPDAPVLIIIYGVGGTADYDEPTTIRKYLDYLKDTKNDRAVVEEMVMDDYGKIKELVLRKK